MYLNFVSVAFGDDCDDDEFTSSSQGFLHWIN